MKNLLDFFKASDVKVNGFESLNENEMFEIRGGTEPVRPTAPPRDRYDDELQ